MKNYEDTSTTYLRSAGANMRYTAGFLHAFRFRKSPFTFGSTLKISMRHANLRVRHEEYKFWSFHDLEIPKINCKFQLAGRWTTGEDSEMISRKFMYMAYTCKTHWVFYFSRLIQVRWVRLYEAKNTKTKRFF